jgi:hypothetical protein
LREVSAFVRKNDAAFFIAKALIEIGGCYDDGA